jgi:hypothetical protein
VARRQNNMDNRYFWIKDRLGSEGIKIQYCPTKKMLADLFTKPLQGALFRKFRDVVLGYKHIHTLNNDDEESSSHELVGNDISKGNIERSQRSDNVKRYDDGPSVEKKDDGQLSYGGNHQLSYADVTRGRK